ncbi:MAG: hypothetical protein FJW36_08690 [Acidobacteria bacterium]|nr:hypothetical protein [Acidobacteriota bacterium]
MRIALLLVAVVGVAQTGYRQQFEDWLEGEARKHWDARDRLVAGLSTRAEIEQRQREIRAAALELIGGLPAAKTPLNAKVTGGFSRDGYRVERIVFESQPGFRVTANLYLPTVGKGPYPAVLGVAGHSANGKASATYQKAFVGFVKRGIAVLAYDPPGQGERLEYFDEATGKSRAGIGVGEHLMAGVSGLLVGQTIARHFVWDGVRAFDYLLTRPEIDAQRIAVAGNSGGGTQAAYLALFEPRLATAVSSCYMTSWRELWVGPGPQDSEQVWPGMISRGLDFGDFALGFAPRPFLITSAIRDYFPIAGARATHKATARLFDVMADGAKMGFFEYDDTHGWSQPRREAATRWLEKVFFGTETDGKEADTETEEESLLYVTGTGQLATSMRSRTVRDLSIEALEELKKKRSTASVSEIRRGVGWVEPQLRPGLKGGGLEVEGGVWIPLEVMGKVRGKGTVVAVGGVEADLKELVGMGYRVVKLSPRGSGPEYPRAGKVGYDLDYQIAARTWLLGRNLLEMQAEDIVSAVRWAEGGEPVVVYACGRFGPAGMLAAVMEPKVVKVLVEGSVESLEDIVRWPLHEGLDNVVAPRVLAWFDLADLRRLLGKGRVMEVGPVNPSGVALRGLGRRLRGEGWGIAKTVGGFL